MGHPLSLRGGITALVHPDALKDPFERACHESFIARQLVIACAALGTAPFYLAFFGVPALWQTLVFIWLMLPLAAIALLSRTGKLFPAQILCIFGLAAATLTLAVGGDVSNRIALAWLVLAPIEGIFSLDATVILAGGLLASGALSGFAMADAFGWSNTNSPTADFTPRSAALCIIPAILATTILAARFTRLQKARAQAEHLRLERYRALSEMIGDLVVFHDRSGAVEVVSRDCEMLCGLSQKELAGRGLFEHIHVGDRPAFLKAVADAAICSETISASFRLRRSSLPKEPGNHREPAFIWIEMRARRFSREDLQRSGPSGDRVIAVLRDVTETRMHQEELEAARAEAERASLWKDHFLANMSHELRTPLNAIIGFSEMLGNPELTPRDPDKQREYAHIIHESGQHLLSVVNSILDMSKIQSGTFEILPEPFEVASLIDLCCDMLKLKAQEGGVELVRAYPAKLDEMIGDKRACKQILLNLLSNAVKFTSRDGRVTIGARPDGNSLLILVSDTGIGIEARDLARLGDPFFQAGTSYDRPYEGTGLGLSVVRGLVGLHGGTIAIESELGKGTCVTVRLPLDCRRFAVKPDTSAKIQTISRRSGFIEPTDPFNESMVKKIA